MNLSVITLGHIHADAFESLTPHVTRLEQIQSNLPVRAPFADARAEFNLAVDAAANDWILVLREREVVDEALAKEMADVLHRTKAAWGYRIRTVPLYAGKALHIHDDGEMRLFHRRHLIRRGDVRVEGAVVRMEHPLHAVTFESYAEHLAYLQKRGVPHSTLRRVLIFLRHARTLDANTLRYLWIEAGFDQKNG